MPNANMTWKPMQCEIITTKIIPPGLNNIQNKWLLIQEHNSPANTPEKQQQTAQPYMQQLQAFYEQQTKQQLQIVKWIPPEPKKWKQRKQRIFFKKRKSTNYSSNRPQPQEHKDNHT